MPESNSAGSVSLSLPEVHGSVGTSQVSLWRRMFAFAGPAYLVSVGYMDPGNWATDLEGGARFGYQLLWVLVMSNAMAILLQTLSSRLGIVSGQDLAQACRAAYPRRVSQGLWVLCEIAIAACDLAEVLGAAIGLNLLFHIPLLVGVLLTAADTLLLLWFTHFGIRIVEAFILALITIIAGCFLLELWFARPDWVQVASGLVPRLNRDSLYVAIGILGATVMPHNLYLHSALVQTRRIDTTDQARRTACRYNLVDSFIALNGALVVNAAILILAGAVFFTRGIVVTEIGQAHLLLAPLLGTTAAGVMFAVALLCSGQSSTLTGTMAGQIIMEGFLDFRMRPWLRRLITRSAAIVPAVLTIYFAGDRGIYRLLILSQVILSMQLPFAVIPLIHFTSDRQRMGAFASPAWVRILAWTTAIIIAALNIRLAFSAVGNWMDAAGSYGILIAAVVIPLSLALLMILAWVTLDPWLPGWARRLERATAKVPAPVAGEFAAPQYRTILVPVDQTDLDHVAVAHAAAMARLSNATMHLLHVEEGVTSLVYGALASTREVQSGEAYLDGIVATLKRQGLDATASVRHSSQPAEAIVAVARELGADLVVMGAHGHKGLKDMVFGTTINAVRHGLTVPILIVHGEH
jgi:manganese transport protein